MVHARRAKDLRQRAAGRSVEVRRHGRDSAVRIDADVENAGFVAEVASEIEVRPGPLFAEQFIADELDANPDYDIRGISDADDAYQKALAWEQEIYDRLLSEHGKLIILCWRKHA